VYIEQPQGFEVEDRKSHVCRLKKALYGLKQAPRAWYGHIDSFLTSLGFTKSKADSNLYFKVMNDEPVCSVPFTTQAHPTSRFTIHYMDLKTNAFNQN
jgi:hypothetical protein